jgi:hypothetical protein
MKHLILSLFAVAVLALAAAALWAQDESAAAPAAGAKADVKASVAWWIDQVGLTDKQKEDIKAILTAAKDEAGQATGAEAKLQVFKAAIEKIHTTILSDEQRAKLQELRQTLIGQAQERLQGMAQQFGISDDQIAAARDILKAAQEQAKDAPDLASKMKIFMDAFGQIRAKVLTDDQRAQMEQARQKLQERIGQILQRLQDRRSAAAE